MLLRMCALAATSYVVDLLLVHVLLLRVTELWKVWQLAILTEDACFSLHCH